MPRRPRRVALLLPLLCVPLARCAPAPEPTLVRPAVPPALLACAPAPAAPDLNVPRWDQVLGRYLLDLGAAGADCRGKLRAVGRLLAGVAPGGP